MYFNVQKLSNKNKDRWKRGSENKEFLIYEKKLKNIFKVYSSYLYIYVLHKVYIIAKNQFIKIRREIWLWKKNKSFMYFKNNLANKYNIMYMLFSFIYIYINIKVPLNIHMNGIWLYINLHIYDTLKFTYSYTIYSYSC